MEKILWLTFIFTLLFVSHSFAAYRLEIKPSGTTINATLSGITNSDVYKLVVQTEPFNNADTTYKGPIPAASAYLADATLKKAAGTPAKPASVSWSLTGHRAETTYYVRVANVTQKSTVVLPSYVTDQGAVTIKAVDIPLQALTTEKEGDGNIVVKGKIDVSKITNFDPTEYRAQLYYTKTVPAPGAVSIPEGVGPLNSRKTDDLAGAEGINADGTYYWHLTSLSPSTTYYLQQKVYQDNLTNGKLGTIDNFNSSTGNIITSSAGQTAYNQSRSYTLLSGFPNFTVLPDPDLCAEQRASGLNPQFCDMNDVINYALKLMIGLAAVVLVFRLMFEGYQYMVTDVPFLKASSKGAFFAALGGLLLALSSYIILNTINPKLVSSNVGITQLAIGIDGDTNIPTVFVTSGKMPGGVYCPGSGRRSAIAKIAQSYIGRVTYSQTNKSATAQADGYARLDCSSFVNTVLNCAGYKSGTDFVNGGTASIFDRSEKLNMKNDFTISGSTVSVKGKALNPGDAVGWPPSGGAGHVLIYIGNATFMDSHGGASGRQPGNAIGVYSAAQVQNLYGGKSPSKTINSIQRIPV